MSKLDIIICIGLDINNNKVKEINKNVKIIFYAMGNIYQLDVYSMLSLNNNSILHKKYDEVWISPQFEFSIDYYRYKYKTNVYVVPFFWKPDFLILHSNNIINVKEIKIAILESNICKEKSCFIPMIACELAKDYITNTKVFNTQRFSKNKSMIDFFNMSELYKSGKLSSEKRFPFCDIMSNHSNIVLSYVENWDLNFLFLECFYLGIPLIHNSKMLKDYGYYYEGCDATKAAEHIKNLKINGFNKEEYIKRHREVLFKYSLENPRVTNFLDSKLSVNKI